MDTQNRSTTLNALVLSAYFGFIILAFDFFLLLIHKADITDPSNFWLNVKYLIWAVGVYYSLKWFHYKYSNPPFLKFLWFAVLVGMFVSLFDIFFYLLYTQIFDPGIKTQMIDQMIKANQQVWNTDPALIDMMKDELTRNFSLLFSFSLWLSYIFLFLFYSVFFTVFIKFTVNRKN